MQTAEPGKYLPPKTPWTSGRYIFVTPLGLVLGIVFVAGSALTIGLRAFQAGSWETGVFGAPETAIETLAAAIMTFTPYIACGLGFLMIGLWVGYRTGLRDDRRS